MSDIIPDGDIDLDSIYPPTHILHALHVDDNGHFKVDIFLPDDATVMDPALYADVIHSSQTLSFFINYLGHLVVT